MVTRTTITEELEVEERPRGKSGLHLLIMSPDSFRTLPLPENGQVKIGRSVHADVQLDDPLASREHAVLHLGERLYIEDLRSANGTHVREALVPPGEQVAITLGEGISVGDTVLMVQQNRARTGRQRILSHGAFETLVEAECDRRAESGRPFAVVRVRLEEPGRLSRVAPVFAREVSPPCSLAVYGPSDYEVLVLDRRPTEVDDLVESLRAGLAQLGISTHVGIAWFPHDGRTVDALVAAGNALVRPHRARAQERGGHEDVVLGPAMRGVYEKAMRAAASNIKVLILGENGVGKDVLARAIHRASPRAEQPLVTINCAAFPESLIESELFGYERGAFTNAVQSKPGLFESADGGTVFLDEIGELPLAMQVRLLQVLQTQQVRRIGSIKERKIDVRFISATNRDIEADVEAGRFRRDLFYRINGMTLTIPPLRDRLSEIEPLARQFLAQLTEDGGRGQPEIAEEVFEILRSYHWPGNVRELRNTIERAIVLCDGDEILAEHLTLERMTPPPEGPPSGDTPPQSSGPPGSGTGGDPAILSPKQSEEREIILGALRDKRWNATQAAKDIGMPRSTFLHKMRKYGIPGSRTP